MSSRKGMLLVSGVEISKHFADIADTENGYVDGDCRVPDNAGQNDRCPEGMGHHDSNPMFY